MTEWIPIRYEERGAILNKIWVTDGTHDALFKPDSEKNESRIEYEVYRIARQLGVPCAKTEVIELFGRLGTLSYNFKTNTSLVYQPTDNLYLHKGELTYKRKDTDSLYLPRISRLSLSAVEDKLPQILDDVVSMLYLDCLVSNRDRHGNNWEVVMKPDGTVISLAPLFDHGLSLENGYDDSMDYCMVLLTEGAIELKHYEMFEQLSKKFNPKIGRLLQKSKSISMNDFSAMRFVAMEQIYDQTASSLKPSEIF